MNEYFQKISEWCKAKPWHAALAAGVVALVGSLSYAYLPVSIASKVAISTANIVACGQMDCPVSSTTP